MVVFPGGGYRILASHEGAGYAQWLAGLGYHAFEVRYRLSTHGYRHPAMWLDAARSLRLVRSRASTFGFDPDRIGVIGSSAGGHLAAHLTTKNDPGDPHATDLVERQSSRPSLAVLCYPVITMSGTAVHEGSRANLLGPSFDALLAEEVSPELLVTSETPPCFVWHTVEDASVPMENSMLFAAALRRAAVPFELHLYEKGRHGLGLADGHPWTLECSRWLRETFRC